MTIFKNVRCIEDPAFDFLKTYPQYRAGDVVIEDNDQKIIDAAHLTLFPGLIDPHVHFRAPGQAYKENWQTAARASISGGYTTVFDMPNNVPPCITRERLQQKKSLIDAELKAANIPLHYALYFGADKNHFHEIAAVRHDIIAIKVFMGSSTGDLLMDDDSSLHAIFAIASRLDLMIAVHAEEECMIQARSQQYAGVTSHHVHSLIRSPEVAAAAVSKAIMLARLYQTRLYILHVSSTQELQLIKAAKEEGLPVYAETTPHHLFLNTTFYKRFGGKVQMNPPLRDPGHQHALFDAIASGVIDTVGSDHAPHTLAEKDKPYGQCCSGVPGIETTLPLLLNACVQGDLTLPSVLSATYTRVKDIFRYDAPLDFVLVDLQKEKVVRDADMKTKCGWTPFAGMRLKGWPRYTCIGNRYFDLEKHE